MINPTVDLALDTVNKGKQALIFVNTKRSAEKTAEEISHKIKKGQLPELSERILKALSRPTKQCERLSKIINKKVAFHHAGLVQRQKELIEDNFRQGNIKVICATPTLAMGVDLPAFRTILKDLRRYTHRGLSYIPVLEYLQMAGRAGRPKFDRHGESICIAKTEADREIIVDKYIKGSPEEIYSKLAVEPVLRIYVLSLISSEFVNSKQGLYDFFARTFFAHQFGDLQKINMLIDKIARLLEEWGFICSSTEDFVDADKMNEDRCRATLLGKRVAELYIDPLTAHHFATGLREAKLHEFSILQMISHTLEIRPLLKVKTKEYDDIQEYLLKYGSYLINEEPNIYDAEYDEFLNSIKTAKFFMDWIDEKDEEFLLETYGIRPGEIRVKLEIADWLLYTAQEIARILKLKRVLLAKLRVRVKNGVKEELVPLLKFKNIGRIRARKLYKNGVKDVKDVKKADLLKLIQILGKNISIDIKKQVGQEFKQVKERKRKGQISLRDY